MPTSSPACNVADEAKQPSRERDEYTVTELCDRFMSQYATRYTTDDGKPSAEVDCLKRAVHFLRNTSGFGSTPTNDFGPLRLQVVRQAMIDDGGTRDWINNQVGRIRLIFKIGVSWEMARSEVWVALKTVPALAVGEAQRTNRDSPFRTMTWKPFEGN
jgi:hypothetical protein